MSRTPENWLDVAPVLDEGWIVHVGVTTSDGVPASLPMLYVRHDASLLLHGGVANATLAAMLDRGRVSGNVTLVDGLIVARSAFQSSVAYRSLPVKRTATLLDIDEKTTALERVIDGLVPGRALEIRPMTSGEIRATVLVRLDVERAVVRESSPLVNDAPSDRGDAVWAGVVPLDVVAGPPRAASDVADDVVVPPSIRAWRPPRG